jgi:OCT family organic cation transporter-like MFS transporter 4/5
MLDNKEKQKKLNIDYFLGCGCYQILHFILSQFVNNANAFNMTMMAFGKIVPKWTCLDWDLNQTSSAANSKQMCSLLKNLTCENMTRTSDFKSVVFEWNLLCDKLPAVFMAITVQMFGVFIGSPIWGQLSDWYGRKWTLFASFGGLLAVGLGSAWSPNMTVFTVVRFFIGFFCGGTITTNYVYQSEFLVAKHRLWINSVAGWPLAYMIMALIGYLTADWRSMTIVSNLISVPGLVILCFMKESPRWLMQKGKYSTATNSLSFVMKLNCVKNNEGDKVESLMQTNKDLHQKSMGKKYAFYHLFMTKKMALETIVLSFCFFTIACISFGIVFDTDSLGGNRFFNFFLYAALRYVASALTITFDSCFKSFGRKLLFLIPMSIVAASSAAIAILKAYEFEGTIYIRVVAMIAATVTSPVWTTITLSVAEIYPTPIRNLGVGFNATFSRLGGIVTPPLLYLSDLWLPSSYLIFALLGVVSCILHGIYIPETKGLLLPETMPKKLSTIKERSGSATTRSNSFNHYKFNELTEKS